MKSNSNARRPSSKYSRALLLLKLESYFSKDLSLRDKKYIAEFMRFVEDLNEQSMGPCSNRILRMLNKYPIVDDLLIGLIYKLVVNCIGGVLNVDENFDIKNFTK